jgi:PIN domain nuclease of toxin-antitoxin system
VLNREPGADRLTPELLSTATSSTVNLAEVQGKLVSLGLAAGDAWDAKLSPIREATVFTAEHGEAAGNLITKTRRLGLSSGPSLFSSRTADRSWQKLKLGVPIHVIR